MHLYGLKNCDTCRRALRDLRAQGMSAQLRDVRDIPLTEDEITLFYKVLGDALVNRRSAAWRGLGADERAQDAHALLRRHPTLMKRPVIERDGALFLGWGAQVRLALLGN